MASQGTQAPMDPQRAAQIRAQQQAAQQNQPQGQQQGPHRGRQQGQQQNQQQAQRPPQQQTPQYQQHPVQQPRPQGYYLPLLPAGSTAAPQNVNVYLPPEVRVAVVTSETRKEETFRLTSYVVEVLCRIDPVTYGREDRRYKLVPIICNAHNPPGFRYAVVSDGLVVMQGPMGQDLSGAWQLFKAEVMQKMNAIFPTAWADGRAGAHNLLAAWADGTGAGAQSGAGLGPGGTGGGTGGGAAKAGQSSGEVASHRSAPGEGLSRDGTFGQGLANGTAAGVVYGETAAGNAQSSNIGAAADKVADVQMTADAAAGASGSVGQVVDTAAEAVGKAVEAMNEKTKARPGKKEEKEAGVGIADEAMEA